VEKLVPTINVALSIIATLKIQIVRLRHAPFSMSSSNAIQTSLPLPGILGAVCTVLKQLRDATENFSNVLVPKCSVG
jgi:hypothetical protein